MAELTWQLFCYILKIGPKKLPIYIHCAERDVQCLCHCSAVVKAISQMLNCVPQNATVENSTFEYHCSSIHKRLS